MCRTSNIILCVGICLGVLGACLLVGFGLRYLKPYIEVKTMKKGLCSVIYQDVSLDTVVPCRCGRDSTSQCQSKYYCSKIMVNFTSNGDVVIMSNVTLYDSYETFLLQDPTTRK